jgi:major membrane immunogen (membrane-anchored lipoprotein)
MNIFRKYTLLAMSILWLAALSSNYSYQDGLYSGTSRAYYTEEYYGNIRIRIENGLITRVVFFIRDSAKNEFFDEKYEKYFSGNDLYIQQCRNDWKGVQSYPDSLLKYQDLGKVDVISGATWSYNLFKYSAEIALSTAVKEKVMIEE